MRLGNEVRTRLPSALHSLLGPLLGLVAALGVLSSALAAQAADLQQSGTVRISQVQIAFLGSGNLGGGTLSIGGKNYAFDVGGLGIGGIGVSRMEAVGEVYNLKNLSDFEGAYLQARYGGVIKERSMGELWLSNPFGVFIRLDAERSGLALAVGADAVYIRFD